MVLTHFSTVLNRGWSGDLALVSRRWQKWYCVHSELRLRVALGLLLCPLGVLPETRKLVWPTGGREAMWLRTELEPTARVNQETCEQGHLVFQPDCLPAKCSHGDGTRGNRRRNNQPTFGNKRNSKFLLLLGFSGGLKNLSTVQESRRRRFDTWVGKISWRRARQPTPIFLSGESLGQSSLAVYSLQSHKESDTTEVT